MIHILYKQVGFIILVLICWPVFRHGEFKDMFSNSGPRNPN